MERCEKCGGTGKVVLFTSVEDCDCLGEKGWVSVEMPDGSTISFDSEVRDYHKKLRRYLSLRGCKTEVIPGRSS